ncbi:MAG: hypothetical protein EAZ91_02340 [Cytophagales bacterium]|nr:MAG: hypothetical protein EAZ91_02340 [Cytophagales bacterium]
MLTTDFQALSQREQLNITYNEGTLLYTKGDKATMHSLYYLDSNFVVIHFEPVVKGWFTSWQVEKIRCYLDMPANTFCLDEFLAEYSVKDLMS